MGPTLKLFEVLQSVISLETFPRTHGRMICAGLAIETSFFPGSLDLDLDTMQSLCFLLS
jgi:hypothetical protein